VYKYRTAQRTFRGAIPPGIRAPHRAVRSFGSAFPFDPNTAPQWGETCPPGYMGVPPYCTLATGIPGVPTVPGVELPGVPAAHPSTDPAATQPPAAAAPAQAQTAPSAASWWAQRTGLEKGMLVGGAAIVGYLLVTTLQKPASAKPGMAYTPNLVAGVKRTKTGVPLVRGKRWGHASPPKKYARLGATKPSQYAYPERYMYPIHDRTHVAAAKGYFTQHKGDYPASIRRQIAGNINQAARRYGLAADVKP